MVADKNPVRVAAGRVAARKRWGAPRVVRLDELTFEQRRLVAALVDAAKEAPAPAKADALEVERASAHTTAAA